MFSAIGTALSGLQASSRRVEAAASNIANARNAIRPEDAELRGAAPAPKTAADGVYRPVRVHQDTAAGGGVRAEFMPVRPAHVLAYSPDDPKADADGYVARPNVDYANEFVDMKQAQHAYEANLKTIETEDKMIGALLDELR
jgi:flagellar basal-body rod protein FlgC